MEDIFRFADELGPRQDRPHPSSRPLGLKAIVVIDNTAAGPAIGGTRMAPDVERRGVRPARARHDAEERRGRLCRTAAPSR